MNPKGLEKLDEFLLNCEDIMQEEREQIMEFVGKYLKDIEGDCSKGICPIRNGICLQGHKNICDNCP